MSDQSNQMPPGWYYAEGDPPNTHRYWDGASWQGEPQAAAVAPQPATQAPSFGAPGEVAAGAYGAAGGVAAGGYGAATGAFSSGVPTAGAPGQPAEWGTRAVAYLIDWAIGMGFGLAAMILGLICLLISDVLAIIVFGLVLFAGLVFGIWNTIIRQGQTGRTIGKEKQNIRLVSDETGQPVELIGALLRMLVSTALGIIPLLDILWPLWDEDKKRLTDKILNNSVIQD